MDTEESQVLGAKTQKSYEDKYYNLLLQANEMFTNAEYDRCFELLEQLETKGESSSQILRHNRAVVSFYKSGCTAHATLLKELNDLDPDVASNGSNESASTMPTLALKHTPSSVARYNKAVIYYHRHMYSTALEKLCPLVSRLKSLEKQTGLLVAALHLQLLLSTNQLNRAEAFLEFLENKLGFVNSATATTDETDSAQHDNLNRVERTNSTLQLLQLLTHVANRKPVVIPEDGSVEYAALKAHQYYIMKDFQMAAKQLMRINNETTLNGSNNLELSTCIANNMGVIHLRVRHYAIAAKFFQNAINFDKKIVDNLRATQLQSMSSARSCEILYNLGISMLHLRRPKEAFQCFLVPIKVYHSNPRLWFRMAEACIMEHEAQTQLSDKQSLTMKSGTKSARKYSTGMQSAAVPEPTLEFAALCLRNALTLTQYYKNHFHIGNDNADESDTHTKNWHEVNDNNFCNPSKPITKESLDNMLAAIYAAYSFVSLCLGDHIIALEMAQELLKSERLSDAHKLLGHMYAGEALMHMNKAPEARAHLEPTFVSSLNAFDFETKDWQVKSLDAAQNVVRYNLAVAMALQYDYESAKSLLNTLTHPIVAAKVLPLRRFIELKLGYSQQQQQQTINAIN